jgi:anti-sigma factor RsiW
MSANGDMTCRELVEIVTDFIEGAMPARERSRFEEHLVMCDGCANYVEQMRETRRAVGALREESISPEARDALLGAFRRWKQE